MEPAVVYCLLLFSRCSNLQELVLTENYIAVLPSTIGCLVKLTNLNVDRNRLEFLPTEVGFLVNLGVLSLRENQVSLSARVLGARISFVVFSSLLTASLPASRDRHVQGAPRPRRVREQTPPPPLHADQLEPEGAVAGREPGQAHAQLPDGLRRNHRRASSHLLSAAAARISK